MAAGFRVGSLSAVAALYLVGCSVGAPTTTAAPPTETNPATITSQSEFDAFLVEDDPATEVDEVAAYETLVRLLDSLAAADYAVAVDFVMEDGVSEIVVEQVGLTEDEAFEPGAMEAALARYCEAVDCAAPYRITRLVESDLLTAVFEVVVDGAGLDGLPLTTEVPVGAFEGQYHVNRLPFGSPEFEIGEAVGDGVDRGEDGGEAPSYSGFESPEGWRLAPESEADPLVTYWNRDGYRVPGHGGLTSLEPLASIGIGGISVLENGYEYIYLQREGDERTIWRDEGDGELSAVVTVPAPQRITLEGVHVSAIEDVDLFYQIDVGGSPEEAVKRLFRHNLPSGEVTEVMETGGWESGSRVFDVTGAYPLAVVNRSSEALTWFDIVDLETGSTVFDGVNDGRVCSDGEVGCVFYEVAALYDGDVIGMRADGRGGFVIDSMVLARFDLESGDEEVLARFEWDNGLWYPRDIMIGGERVIVSVGTLDGSIAYPAVMIDPATGEAATLSIAGFVGPTYLS